jgi:hypothetical protein
MYFSCLTPHQPIIIFRWQPWLVFFLRILAEQVRRLEKKIERAECGPAIDGEDGRYYS